MTGKEKLRPGQVRVLTKINKHERIITRRKYGSMLRYFDLIEEYEEPKKEVKKTPRKPAKKKASTAKKEEK